jgi:Ca2+-binding RTX toxin-like protein
MSNLVNDPNAANLVGLWDFLNSGPTADTGLADGVAQNGALLGGASVSGGQLHLNGYCQIFSVQGDDDPFDLGVGTISTQFTQSNHVGSSPDVIVNRGEYADRGHEGYFEIRVTQDGRVEVMHCAEGVDLIERTPKNFFDEHDTLNVTYSWDESTGASFIVENLTTGATYEANSDKTGLTMDIGDNDDENFTIGARETDDGKYGQYFHGSVDYVAIYDTDIINAPASSASPDGIVDGTDGDDVIDVNYTGDENGDMIDNGDALFPGQAADDDIVVAGLGNDTVIAGAGNDNVYGEQGDDTLYGDEGDDVLLGGVGNDTLNGGHGDDMLMGGAGDDVLNADGGNDIASGGDGTDRIFGSTGDDLLSGDKGDDEIKGAGGNDVIAGGAGIDRLSGGAGNDTIYGGGIGDATNLIYNGSFENTAGMTATGYGFEAADGNADGWTDSTGESIDFHNNGRGGVQASDGSNWLDTEDSPGNNLIGQDIQGVVDGQPYTLTFDAADGNHIPQEDDNQVQVFWGGELVATIDPSSNVMTEYQFVLIGGAGDGSNRLEFSGLGIEDNFGASIDNVQLMGLGAMGADDDDEISGGDGDDLIYGQEGDDWIQGGAGDDTIYGGVGNDMINGDGGNDTIFGGAGDDMIDGGDGDDWIWGREGDDVIKGGAGNDNMLGDGGNDDISGGLGNDNMSGMDGDDILRGGEGMDDLTGGRGNDTIIGGVGADWLNGNEDRDLFIGGNADDMIDGGEGGDDYDTLDLTGAAEAENAGGSLKVNYDADNRENGKVVFFDADGAETGSLMFKNIENVIPCFTPGTLIATPTGERKVEDLKAGDRVITRDNGIQEIRWAGKKAMKGSDFKKSPHLRPVLIQKGALGNGLPERDMLVSPNHRILVASDMTALYFEEREVLVAAKHLTGMDGVDVVDVSWTTYIHFMFDQHEVVLSDGSWTESFQPGAQALAGVGQGQRAEILELFPELRTKDGIEDYHTARKSLKKHEAALLTK